MATEQKTKWTPGPWEFNRDGGDCIIGKDGRGIASLAAECDEDWMDGAVEFGGEHEANARLIAAAPTLVEAVREAITYINGETNGYADDEEQQSARCVLDDLRYALAQATGEGWE